ncbi:ATPase, T2SS/T4P/T4SS family [Clostridiaceae bacterium HSG29]|nr:ATPase, T2SS/T4P/T4SS family [Clostridiaceae bacterium HSG29]
MNNIKKIRLGDKLVQEGLITEEQLNGALLRQKISGNKLGEQIIEDNLLTENQIFNFLEIQLGIKHVNLQTYVIDINASKMINEKFARKNGLISIKIDNGKLIVAMADPLDLRVIDDIFVITGMQVEPRLATKSSIKRTIDKVYKKSLKNDRNKKADYSGMTTLDSDVNISNAPIVKLVNKIITAGLKAKASDIHIEPSNDKVRVRFRVDGDLREYMKSEMSNHAPLVTRIKIMGEMDISEKRKPQDGRIETIIDSHLVDMRISALPTVYGEKVVIRLLDRSSVVIDKKILGLTKKDLTLIEKMMKYPQGMILVTGPTGSGKTTTLYTMLNELNVDTKNIITVEDPVEYRLNGINQVQVNLKAGLTFATGLRSILRQDPDIVMIGEIRDSETAEIAIRASITGHLVLSTLHTNDTASTIARLIDMGIEPYILSSSLAGIISQRLVKKLCNSCKKSHITTESEMRLLGIDKPIEIFEKVGCSACGNIGYSGRTGIYEMMIIDKEIREKINTGGSTDEIRRIVFNENSGMKTLSKSCKNLIISGKTTTDELIRVAYSVE